MDSYSFSTRSCPVFRWRMPALQPPWDTLDVLVEAGPFVFESLRWSSTELCVLARVDWIAPSRASDGLC